MQFLDTQFDRPLFMSKTAWLRHGPFALWLVRTMEPRCIVELGTHFGYSYFCFCQTVLANDLSTKCYAIDTWLGDEHAGLYDDSVFEVVKKENDKYQNFSTLLRKTFADALSDIEDGSVDILHVDGRHFYEDVKEDFESWIPKLSDRAVVLFHDTEVRERNFGVHRYWDEISAGRSSLNFPFQFGLGVLFWGSNIPEGLKPLVSELACEVSRKQVINHFERLGESFARAIQPSATESNQNYSEFSNEHGKLPNLENQLTIANIKLERANARLSKSYANVQLLQSHLRAARNRPLKLVKRNVVRAVLRGLAKASPPFSKRRVERFLRSAAKRDPNRNDLLKSYIGCSKPNLLDQASPPEDFDPAWYLETYPDVDNASVDPLEHYMGLGKAEGRRANALDRSRDISEAHLDIRKIPAIADEVALFVTFAPAGQIKPHVPRYLDALKRAGLSIVLIIAADDPEQVELGDLFDRVDGLFIRQNGGYDFAAWAHVAREIDLSSARLVCLANDSLVGPFTDESLHNIMRLIRDVDADLVGLTSSDDLKDHLQSFFLVAKDQGIGTLLGFLKTVRMLEDKWQVIFSYEIQVSDFFRSKGLQVRALFPSFAEMNRTVYEWRELINEGFPFVKMEVLQNSKTQDWKALLTAEGYDAQIAQASVDLIRRSHGELTAETEVADTRRE